MPLSLSRCLAVLVSVSVSLSAPVSLVLSLTRVVCRYVLKEWDIGEHAVVMEIDEVMLHGWEHYKSCDFTNIPQLHDKWVLKAAALPVQPMLQFYNQLRDEGVCMCTCTLSLC